MAIDDNTLYALTGSQVKELVEKVKESDAAFKPFPASVVTDGTTEQFMNSILALNAPVGTAYLGTVSLSDLPAGLVQEEVAAYVYSDYIVYCDVKSTDVAPYEWWCASYNYGGWRPVNTTYSAGTGLELNGTTFSVDNTIATKSDIPTTFQTIFYMNASETGGTRHIYKKSDMTDPATSKDVFDANEKGQVILRISTSSTPDMYSDAYLQNAYSATGDYQLLFLDEKTYRSFDTTNLTDSTFVYSSRVIQDKLTAGTNVQINGATISATDTTYSAFTGTDGQTAGSAGLVPAPATTDAGKYLNSDGTWTDAPKEIIQNAGAPTTSTAGTKGQLLVDTTNGELYQCTAIVPGTDPDPDTYTWSEVAKTGDIPAVVQTTGFSTTDVMSQNATTKMVFSDTVDGQTRNIRIGQNAICAPPTGYPAIAIGVGSRTTNLDGVAIGPSAGVNSTSGGCGVAIGYDAKVSDGGGNAIAIGGASSALNSNTVASAGAAIAIGYSAKAAYQGSVALGAGAQPSAAGEMNIGATNTGYGYNSSDYRLLTGLYDGQGIHDAATVAQGNTLSTSAPTTATEGVLGQLYTDTANMHTYQLTSIDTTDPQNPSYIWTQRW